MKLLKMLEFAMDLAWKRKVNVVAEEGQCMVDGGWWMVDGA
jgi:hypothetical protein